MAGQRAQTLAQGPLGQPLALSRPAEEGTVGWALARNLACLDAWERLSEQCLGRTESLGQGLNLGPWTSMTLELGSL